MKRSIIFLLTASILLTVLSAFADDLPMLQSATPVQLPSLSTATINMSDPEKMISVTCYFGNPLEGRSVATIMIQGAAAAGPSCNSMFYDCKGRCFGCFSDSDLSRDICADNNSRKFLR
ncbi:MAG: hypothetical protein ACOYL3_12570 [Desulfuromonadaceae bacterium]